VVTRRGLLAAGAGAGLVAAGCGAQEEPPPDAELLAPSLAAALALADAYGRAPGTLARELAERAGSHAERLRSAGARGGARPPAAGAGEPPEQALRLEQAALRAHLHAVGLVRDEQTRLLLAGLMADSARNAALLRSRLGLPDEVSAFPDGRDA
jgi:hypothetical protein